jgi:thiol-disulfide isomerase/thioredoxin
MFRKIKPFLKPDYAPAGAILLIILILLFYFYLNDAKEGFENDCGISELKAKEESKEKTLVLLYADWCGHCKDLDPVWAKASSKSNGRMIQRNVGAKDPPPEKEAENKAIMDKYGVEGFPTIILLQNGKAVPYEGPRTVEAFLEKLK